MPYSSRALWNLEKYDLDKEVVYGIFNNVIRKRVMWYPTFNKTFHTEKGYVYPCLINPASLKTRRLSRSDGSPAVIQDLIKAPICHSPVNVEPNFITFNLNLHGRFAVRLADLINFDGDLLIAFDLLENFNGVISVDDKTSAILPQHSVEMARKVKFIDYNPDDIVTCVFLRRVGSIL